MSRERNPYPLKMVAVPEPTWAAMKARARAEDRTIGAVADRAFRFYESLPLDDRPRPLVSSP